MIALDANPNLDIDGKDVHFLAGPYGYFIVKMEIVGSSSHFTSDKQ